MKYIIIAIIAIALGGGMLSLSYSSAQDEINDWAKEKKFTILKKEAHVTIFGTPYLYLPNGSFIMEIDIATEFGTNEKWWMRQGALFIPTEFEKDKE